MTDADVDGSHIRTLILTFFYRMMPEVIDRGYLYLAQPPLYRVSVKRSDRYLQNDAELNSYLVERVVIDREVRIEHTGTVYTGEHLRELMMRIFGYRDHMDRLERRGFDRRIIRALANAGFRKDKLLESEESFAPIREKLEASGYEVEYIGINEEHSLCRFRITRRIDGLIQETVASDYLLELGDYRKLFDINEKLEDLRTPPFSVTEKGKEGEKIYNTKEEKLNGL